MKSKDRWFRVRVFVWIIMIVWIYYYGLDIKMPSDQYLWVSIVLILLASSNQYKQMGGIGVTAANFYKSPVTLLLNENESVLSVMPVRFMSRKYVAIEGKLFITGQRVCFVSSQLTFEKYSRYIALSSIAKSELIRGETNRIVLNTEKEKLEFGIDNPVCADEILIFLNHNA